MSLADSYSQQIKPKVQEFVSQQGAEVVEFKVFFAGRKVIVRCLIDYPQGGITIDDCATVNKKIGSYIEENNVIAEDYIVEVNSPGLDRKLTNAKDFSRVKGRDVCLWLKEPVNDKTYLEAKVLEVNDGFLSLMTKDKIIELGLDKIKTAKEKIM